MVKVLRYRYKVTLRCSKSGESRPNRSPGYSEARSGEESSTRSTCWDRMEEKAWWCCDWHDFSSGWCGWSRRMAASSSYRTFHSPTSPAGSLLIARVNTTETMRAIQAGPLAPGCDSWSSEAVWATVLRIVHTAGIHPMEEWGRLGQLAGLAITHMKARMSD